jgi:hypothetical protein
MPKAAQRLMLGRFTQAKKKITSSRLAA